MGAYPALITVSPLFSVYSVRPMVNTYTCLCDHTAPEMSTCQICQLRLCQPCDERLFLSGPGSVSSRSSHVRLTPRPLCHRDYLLVSVVRGARPSPLWELVGPISHTQHPRNLLFNSNPLITNDHGLLSSNHTNS